MPPGGLSEAEDAVSVPFFGPGSGPRSRFSLLGQFSGMQHLLHRFYLSNMSFGGTICPTDMISLASVPGSGGGLSYAAFQYNVAGGYMARFAFLRARLLCVTIVPRQASAAAGSTAKFFIGCL